MAKTRELDIKLAGLGGIVAASRHAVPIYQRSYAWKDDHVEDLLNDIATAIRDGDEEYFLGSIVLTNADSDQPDVVDGQQRLATTVIVIAAIRDFLLRNEQQTKADEIGRTYLASVDLRTEELEPRLRLNSVDNDFFINRIVTEPSKRKKSKPELESHRRIDKAAAIAAKRIKAVAGSSGSRSVDALIDWIDFIHKKAKVISVSVPSDANAFTIFETLNDRGLALAITDLLKNYLFSKAGSRLEEVQGEWTSMGSVLEAIGSDEVVVDYVRHFWSSQHGLAREKQLYKEIRKKVSTSAKSVGFVADLNRYAKTYCALFNSGHPFWKPYGDVAKSYVAAINSLQTRESLPLLLAIAVNFSTSETVKALRLLVSCIVRSLVVSGRGGTLEVKYSAIAKLIFEKEIVKETDLRAELLKIVPTDSEFREAFSVASSSNSQRVRYWLREIEAYSNAEKAGWKPSESVDDVSLEHVLPLNLSEGWGDFDEESHRTYVRRLGNLAILGALENSDIGNGGFTEKKKVLKNSNFNTTSSIARKSAWTAEAIIERQEQLAELAVKTWPLSGAVRKPIKRSAKKKVKRKAKRSN